jgi:hypothetical protein
MIMSETCESWIIAGSDDMEGKAAEQGVDHHKMARKEWVRA